MSRMTARDTTIPAPAESPCNARRNSTSEPMLSASAQPAEAMVNTASPHSTTGRRPKLSDSAPWNSVMKAKANKYTDSVCCICTGVACSDCAMAENAGR
jgi:hypothetical protein